MTELARRTELIIPAPAEALAGLLGVPMPDLGAGEGLPLLWHWLYLLDRPPQAALGADGHPASGSIPSPPGPDRRRMFAGGRVTQHGPMRTGVAAIGRTWLKGTVNKQGRSGPLVFASVCREISQNGALVVTEEQDIVYRDAAAPVHAGPAGQREEAPSPGAWHVKVDPILLFRFSALTYNAHRIHYDREYARDVEGYPGLVVHGPLQALLMAELSRRSLPSHAHEIAYRLVSPLCEGQGLVVTSVERADGIRAVVQDSGGRTTATAVIHPAWEKQSE